MGLAGSNENQADAPTVLVVEDEVLIRMATADYLRCRVHGREHAGHS
jgi:hypothetical protein